MENKQENQNKNQLKINYMFNKNGQNLEKLIEDAFEKYCNKIQ